MDYNKIRQMSDEELKEFLTLLKRQSNPARSPVCQLCPQPKSFHIKAHNILSNENRVILCLCPQHYQEFLDKNGLVDPAWTN